jgi:hypothetical protein
MAEQLVGAQMSFDGVLPDPCRRSIDAPERESTPP